MTDLRDRIESIVSTKMVQAILPAVYTTGHDKLTKEAAEEILAVMEGQGSDISGLVERLEEVATELQDAWLSDPPREPSLPAALPAYLFEAASALTRPAVPEGWRLEAAEVDAHAAPLTASLRAALFVNEVLECARMRVGLSANDLRDVAERFRLWDDTAFRALWDDAWAARCSNMDVAQAPTGDRHG